MEYPLSARLSSCREIERSLGAGILSPPVGNRLRFFWNLALAFPRNGVVVSPDLILERAGCRLGESVLFGVFQAGIAYSDLKADCGGGAQHAKLPFADRTPAGIKDCLSCIDTAIDTARIVR